MRLDVSTFLEEDLNVTILLFCFALGMGLLQEQTLHYCTCFQSQHARELWHLHVLGKSGVDNSLMNEPSLKVS